MKNHTTLSFLLYGFVGLVASVLLALIFSFVFPNRKKILGYTWESRNRERGNLNEEKELYH